MQNSFDLLLFLRTVAAIINHNSKYAEGIPQFCILHFAFCILHFAFCIQNIINRKAIYNVFPSPESRTETTSLPFSDMFLKLPTTWPTGSMTVKVLG